MSIPAANQMRIFGAATMLSAIIQIGVSAGAYTMTSWKVGAWWAGAFAFITSILALISTDKCTVGVGCALSVITIILLIVGLILDGIIYGATNALDTCGDTNTGEIYGDTANTPYLISCAVDNHQDCLCIQSSNTDTCYLFNLESADNCGQILNKLPSLLLASVLFELVLVGTVFTYSVCTCKTVCCTGAEDQAAMNAAANSSHAAPAPATAVAVPSKV